MITLYGIPNCDTIKKARTWLDKNKVSYVFHNYKTEGISAKKITGWCRQMGWERLLNKQSTTWRGLDKDFQETVTTQKDAIALMQQSNSIIKRPVIEQDDRVLAVGFKPDEYAELFLN